MSADLLNIPTEFGHRVLSRETVTPYNTKCKGERVTPQEIVGSLVLLMTETPSLIIIANALRDLLLSKSQLERLHKVITVTLDRNIET